LTEAQINAIYEFHAEQSAASDYWAEQEGCMQDDDNYISFNVYNVMDEFDTMCDKAGIDQSKMIFLEY
jgi:hypothetical protein